MSNQTTAITPVVLNGISGRQGPASDMVAAPVPFSACGQQVFQSDYSVDMERWYSMTTIPEFLLGVGGREADGYGTTDIDTNSLGERPALGIRSPLDAALAVQPSNNSSNARSPK